MVDSGANMNGDMSRTQTATPGHILSTFRLLIVAGSAISDRLSGILSPFGYHVTVADDMTTISHVSPTGSNLATLGVYGSVMMDRPLFSRRKQA